MDCKYIVFFFLICFVQTISGSVVSLNMTECHNAGKLCVEATARCYFDTANKNYTCRCFHGYQGELCGEDMNECERGSAPCLKRGVCHNFKGSFRCDCLPGWKGTHCQSVDGSGNTTCMSGYTGANCSQDFDECTQWPENPCEHGSTCINTLGNFTCTCSAGWQGRICHKDVDECALTSGLCHNGGNCSNTPGSYTCICPYPYTGHACDQVSTTTTTTTTTAENGGGSNVGLIAGAVTGVLVIAATIGVGAFVYNKYYRNRRQVDATEDAEIRPPEK